MAERDRIARHFAPLTKNEPGSFHLTDDAAVLNLPTGRQLVVTTDSVIEGIHVLPGASAAQIAQKLVRRNLSDLAAMGAAPWRYFLNLHTPAAKDDDWFAEFAAMLRREQEQFAMALAGGDSTSGGNTVHATLTCLGLVETPLLRSTAQAGDDVYVSGTIGDAALGLYLLKQGVTATELAARYHCPEPRLALGQKLHGVASAAIDISDGLLGDAQQLAQASGKALALERAAIPLSQAVRTMLARDEKLWAAILTGGDDYELLFTAPASKRTTLPKGVTRIGLVTEGTGVTLDGQPVQGGWEHH
jgi:thiamine-monophosphate kinase